MAVTTVRGEQITDATVSLTVDVTGTLPAANGGTGNATNTLNAVLLGNGTGALQALAPGVNLKAVTSNGTTFINSISVAEAVGVAKMTVGTTAPASPTTGDLWIDTN